MINITSPISEAKARKKILAGVNAVYNIVKLTLGPEGRNAILPRSYNRGPRNTNDGFIISENIMPKDEHERLVADYFKEGAKRTNEEAGDGTTTTAVIAGHAINKIFRERSSGDTPSASLLGKKQERKGARALKREMKDAKDLVVEAIKERAKPIKTLADLEKIAIVAIGKEDAEVAKVVAKMVWDLGRDANGNYVDNHIDIVEGYKQEVEIEKSRGMRFPSKVAHRIFVNKPERFEMVAEDVAVFITNYKLDNPHEVVALLNICKVPKIAIFAPDFGAGVIKSLIETTKGGMFCYPIKCPSLRTPQLEDLAIYTGATLIDKDKMKLSSVTVAHLGKAEKIVVRDTEVKEDAILLGGAGEKTRRGQGNLVTERQGVLKKQLLEARNDLSKAQLEKRIANLSSAVGVIRVGMTTSGEGLWLKLKVEDGMYACKAALQEGYVEGGGLCLKKIAEKLPKNILTDSLIEPYEQIQKNAGGGLEIGKDIIDPAKVVRLEVEHGVSIAAQMITTDILIPEVREKNPAEGYEAIAKSINNYVIMEMKHRGMLKENQNFQDDAMDKAFEEAEFNDQD